jgi:hypothetical protein
LESVCWGNSTVGSNPTLSAILPLSFLSGRIVPRTAPRACAAMHFFAAMQQKLSAHRGPTILPVDTHYAWVILSAEAALFSSRPRLRGQAASQSPARHSPKSDVPLAKADGEGGKNPSSRPLALETSSLPGLDPGRGPALR